MLKRVIYLMAVLWIMAVGTVFAEEGKDESQAGWQIIDIGPAEDIEYSLIRTLLGTIETKTAPLIRISSSMRKRKQIW